jgi:hypothetical protein
MSTQLRAVGGHPAAALKNLLHSAQQSPRKAARARSRQRFGAVGAGEEKISMGNSAPSIPLNSGVFKSRANHTPGTDSSIANLANFNMAAFVLKGNRPETASFAIPCTSDHAYKARSSVFPAGNWPSS